MLDSVREIHGHAIYTTNNTLQIYSKINNSHVNKQLTNHSSATEQEIAEE